MESLKQGAKVEEQEKVKGKRSKIVESEDGVGCRLLQFLFCCLAFRPKAKGSPDSNNNEDEGSSCSNDNGRDREVAMVSSNTNNSAMTVTAESTPNLVAEQRSSSPPCLRTFSYSDLESATMGFRPEHFLGKGGFGEVFKGWLTQNGMSPTTPGMGMPVAVKTLNPNGRQGHREWLAEVKYLGQLQHPNLVKLVGFCNEGDKRLLVYEFMPRGSLESHLFQRSVPFPWSTRMKVMLDAAKGLEYLHLQSDDKNAVIFRDFKASNVLLDRGFNAKLSDFGLARDGPQGDQTHVSTIVMGTPGYTAPEYVMTGRLTAKSDVYSFGVVLLEMITGRRVRDNSRPSEEQKLVEWARKMMKKGGKYCHMVVVDPRLGGRYSIRGSLRALSLAIQCVRSNPSTRPKMSRVVQEMHELSYLVDDMAFLEPSSSQVVQVIYSNSNFGERKYGLIIGSSSKNAPRLN